MTFSLLRNWLLALCVALLAGCGGGSGSSAGTPVVGPGSGSGGGTGTGSTSSPSVTVSLSSSTVTAASPATVTVTVRDAAGVPISGTVVDLSTKRGTFATLNLASVRTDAGGNATATLSAASAGQSGADDLLATATLGTTTVDGSASFTVAGSQPTISLAISSTTLRGSSGAATLVAVVRNAAGVAQPNVLVNFSSASGKVTLGAASVVTDAAALNASVTAAPADPSVTVADSLVASATVDGVTVHSQLPVQVVADVPAITLQPSGSPVTAAVPVTLSILVKDARGNPVGAGTLVSLASSFGLVAFDAASVSTSAAGVAQVVMTPKTATSNGADQVVATAKVGGVTATTQLVTQVASTATASVSISIAPSTVTASVPATVTVTVRDTKGSPVPGALVALSTVRGGLATLGVSSVATDANGTATATLSATSAAVGGADQVLGAVTTGGGTVQGSASFTVAGGLATLTLSADKSTLQGAADSATLSAVVRDATGTILKGVPVTFTSLGGRALVSAQSMLTDAVTGKASVTVRPANPGLTVAETLTATATVGSTTVQGSLAVQLLAATPTITVSAVPATTTVGSPSTLSVVVKDASGAAVGAGVVVSVSSTYGLTAFDAATASTVNGIATFQVTPKTAASNGADVVVVSATVGGVAVLGQAVIQVLPASSSVAGVVLTLSSAAILNDGSQTVIATAYAVDSNKNTVAGVPITISADTGVVISNSKVTDASGTLTATIGIGSNQALRNMNVKATSGSLAQVTQLLAVIAPAASNTPAASSLSLTLSATTMPNNGSQTVTATALALDANTNTVAGVPVTISSDSGVVTASGNVTSAAGAVTAAVGIGDNSANRTITVTARSGALSKSAQLKVVDSTGGAGTQPSDLLLTVSAASMPVDGSQPVTATVTALDAKRNVLSGVVVSLSVDSGATIAPSGTATGANGVLTGTIGVGSAALGSVVTVTASAGGLTQTAKVNVVAAPVAVQPTAADLALSLSSSTINNGGSQTITATATAVDSNRNALAGIPVTFVVDSNAVAVPSAKTTNASGIVTAAIGVGADRTNRVITVTATSGSITRSLPIAVVGAQLSASLSPVVNAGSVANQVQYKLIDFNGLAMGQQSISVTAKGAAPKSGVTDSNGQFAFTYDAPGVADAAYTIDATAAGTSLSSVVNVVIGGGVPAATTVPQSASLTPSPSVISTNTAGSTTNQVELRALFVGANNLPIPNIRVRFDLVGANQTYGTASYVGSFAYSDAAGVARGTFTPGQIASPTNGVTVRACWDLNDFAVGACPNAVTSTLTVASEALSVSIRTNNLILEGVDKLTYIKKFIVMVVDSAGQAKGGALITPSVDLPAYYKGNFTFDALAGRWVQNMTLAGSENWSYDASTGLWARTGVLTQPSCLNEDVNRNGVLEIPVPGNSGEDLNGNGQLDPRKADVSISMVGSATTDASGLAEVQIEYGKSVASWVDFVITVTATGISGTEARAKYMGLFYGLGPLPYLASDATDANVPPPFVISPYGRATVCTNPN